MSNIRFCQNNFLQVATSTVTASSALAGFPIGNAYDTYRYRAWRSGGHFLIEASPDNELYINDGSNKTASVTALAYTTGAALAAAVQTALNAVSTNWTCTYSTVTGKFTIGRSSGTALLRLSVASPMWDILGYTGVVDDDVGTGQAADARRNHTSETVTVDLGAALEIRAFHAIAAAGVNFSLSDTAACTLKANNSPVFTSPPLSVSFNPELLGIFQYLEVADHPSTTYRYWQFEYVDRENPNGPNFPINQMYLGNYVSPADRNVNIGLQRAIVNESRFFTSAGGVRYARRVPVYERYSSSQVEFLIDQDRLDLERVFREVGTTEPLFISYDPSAIISDSVGEFTKYMQVENADVRHQLYKYHTIDFAAREVI